MSEIILTMNHIELFMVASYCCMSVYNSTQYFVIIPQSLSHFRIICMNSFPISKHAYIHSFREYTYSSSIDTTSSISIYSLIKSHFHLNQSFPEFLPQFNLFFGALIFFVIHITFVQPEQYTSGLVGSIWTQKYVIIATIMIMFTQFITRYDPVMIE
jgi:hypothetical protein